MRSKDGLVFWEAPFDCYGVAEDPSDSVRMKKPHARYFLSILAPMEPYPPAVPGENC